MYISHSQTNWFRVARWSLKNGSLPPARLPTSSLIQKKTLQAHLILTQQTIYSKGRKNSSA